MKRITIRKDRLRFERNGTFGAFPVSVVDVTNEDGSKDHSDHHEAYFFTPSDAEAFARILQEFYRNGLVEAEIVRL